MKKKELARGIIFLLLAALIFQLLTTIFIPKWYGTWQSTRIVDGFYELPENSLDVVLLGSSQTIMGLSPMELYEEYGISAYSFGTEEQPIYATYYWLKEILRYHTPKVAVVDVNELIHTCNEAAYRKAFDYMEWSDVKWEAIKTHCETDNELSLMSYILPFTNYHSRWNELDAADFTYLTADKTDPYLGFVVAEGSCEIDYHGISDSPEMEPEIADPEAYEYLLKMIRLCEEEGIQLLMVKTPRPGWNPHRHNLVEQISQETGIPFLDFNDEAVMSAMDFQYMTDARDGSHLNIYGAEKVGSYLGAYLSEHYELTDRRNDSSYSHLTEMYDLYVLQTQDRKLASAIIFEDWLSLLQERYIMLMAVSDSYLLEDFSDEIWAQLKTQGVNISVMQTNTDYVCVQQGTTILTQQAGDDISAFTGNLPDGTWYELSIFNPENETEASVCSICIDHEEYALAGEGLHIVVYDPVDHQVIDRIRVDGLEELCTVSR